MSNDLVKRLRDWSEYDEGKINDAREEAADRIEQLEMVLRDLLNLDQRCGWHSKQADAAIKALEGKDETV